MGISGRFWVMKNGKSFLGEGRIDLLKNIDATGSISAAAKAMGMSYKAAWDDVDMMNNLAGAQLVTRNTGGKHGGGTSLTGNGLKLIDDYAYLNAIFEEKLRDMQDVYDFFLRDVDSVNFIPVSIISVESGRRTIMEMHTARGLPLKASVPADIYMNRLRHSAEHMACISPDKLILAGSSDRIAMDEEIRGVLNSFDESEDYISATIVSESGDTFSVRLSKRTFDNFGLDCGQSVSILYNTRDVVVIGR